MNQALEDPKPICDKSVFTYFHNVVGREAVQGGCKKMESLSYGFVCSPIMHPSRRGVSVCLIGRSWVSLKT